MPWDPTKPLATDFFGDSQLDLLNNNTALNFWMDQDHYVPNSGSDGRHKQLTFPELNADPGTGANEAALYTRQGATSALAELFFQREGAVPGRVWSEFGLATPDGPHGFFYLAGGQLMVRFGLILDGFGNPFTVNYGAPAFAGGTTPIVYASPVFSGAANQARSIEITASVAASFTVRGISASTGANGIVVVDIDDFDFFFVAIGVPA